MADFLHVRMPTFQAFERRLFWHEGWTFGCWLFVRSWGLVFSWTFEWNADFSPCQKADFLHVGMLTFQNANFSSVQMQAFRVQGLDLWMLALCAQLGFGFQFDFWSGMLTFPY